MEAHWFPEPENMGEPERYSTLWSLLTSFHRSVIPVLTTPFFFSFYLNFLNFILKESKVKVLIFQSCLTLCNPMDCSPSGSSLSMGFSRQECWSGLPFPSPEDLPDPGTEPASSALQTDSLPSEPPGKPNFILEYCCLIAQSCPALCNPRSCSTPGFPVLHYLPEFAQTHVH